MKAIVGATLLDGTDTPPVQNATVLTEKDRIKAVGPTGEVQIPPQAQVIDASGTTLMPGLIDCHDHMYAFGDDLATRWVLTEPQSLRHMRIAALLKRTLETGYTTIRDAGYLDAGFRQAVEEGLIPGPRLQVALAVVTPTGGLGDHRSPSGHENPAHQDPNLPSGVANGPEGIRAKVRELVRAGADYIRFATTGAASSSAGLGPKDTNITREEVEALVDEAHSLGRRVMCDALGGPGLRAAVEAGVDSLEHGVYLDEDPDLVTIMAQRGTFLVPTLSVYVYYGQRGTPHGRARAAAFLEHHAKSLRLALEAGVKVAAGADWDGWVHGNNAQEITCLVNAGMTPMEAIVAATGHAAECIGLDHELGTIAAGKKADLILVEGNPLEDISVLEEGKGVRMVMKDGAVHHDRGPKP